MAPTFRQFSGRSAVWQLSTESEEGYVLEDNEWQRKAAGSDTLKRRGEEE